MPKDFKPPKHKETHTYIFDRQTGEIIGEHTRWVETGADAPDAGDAALIAALAKDSGRAAKDLDVLQAKPRAGRGLLRVDVKTRKLVTERPSKDERIFMPQPLDPP